MHSRSAATALNTRALTALKEVFGYPAIYGRGLCRSLFHDVPVWDNPRLVVNDEMAASLSRALGERIACLMRGHGSVVVDETHQTALVACTYREENVRYQLEAERLSGAKALSEDERRDCAQGRSAWASARGTTGRGVSSSRAFRCESGSFIERNHLGYPVRAAI
jgi:ribulose-5-phosphate 4-epimerase/fuculose-1-phosphate aldolase